ncbi:MAG: hypothetical protein WA865_08070 [Spirulinaceae cyanobacterium]
MGQLLATKTSVEITANDIRTELERDLAALTSKAFQYFLPACLYFSLELYESLSIFADGLIDILTKPSRNDIVETYDYLAQCSPGLPDDMLELNRKQQLEWFDSGRPSAEFHERFDSLTPKEGKAILRFLLTFKESYNKNYPFGELVRAINRHWIRYQDL